MKFSKDKKSNLKTYNNLITSNVITFDQYKKIVENYEISMHWLTLFPTTWGKICFTHINLLIYLIEFFQHFS